MVSAVRHADRLFQIIQVLRRSARPVTAAALAAELEVSPRTVYRDIADLIGQRVPIMGEAGIGYLLAPGHDLPPLMFTPEELEAVALGAGWVANNADPALATAAADVIAKVAAVIPVELRPHLIEPGVGVRPGGEPDDAWARAIRHAIREHRKLRLRYRSAIGDGTERIVHPVVLGHGEDHRLLIAWCELRGAFRHFRLEKITALEVLPDPVAGRPGELRRRWLRWREAQGWPALP